MEFSAQELQKLYTDTLYQQVVPFWLQNSLDTEHGGYLTCLDDTGKVFDTDKFIWLQARQVWMFSKLYNAKKDEEQFLRAAECGAQFLEKYGHDEKGYFYFSVTRKGIPISQPHSIFSDCFASMAFAQFFKAKQNKGEDAEWAKKRAIATFENIEQRKSNPKGQYNKAYPGTRPLSSLAVPMIDINLCLELSEVLPELNILDRVEANLNQIWSQFYDAEHGLLRENVPPVTATPEEKQELLDTFEGRLINPGHSIECLWFMMDVARKLYANDGSKRDALIDKCATVLLKTLDYGWDKEYEGFFYFLDIQNKPPQQLEWDQKLWWVHCETLVALSLAYLLTKNEQFAVWYNKVHKYTWSKFVDKERGGEWYGYLNRQGQVLLKLKGGKWKGCFHVPRSLFLCASIFGQYSK